MFRWLRKGKKSDELVEAVARVERAQRALIPLQPLGPALAARLQTAETTWRAARADEERGDEPGALRGYEEARAALAAVRGEAVALAPEQGLMALLAEIEELVANIENADARGAAWLELFAARLLVGDAAGAERMLAAESDPPVSAAFVRLLFQAERAFGDAAWLRAARERAVERLLEFPADTPEGAEAHLDLALALCDAGERAAARAMLDELDGEFRDQGLLAWIEAEARAGSVEAARAAMEELEGRAARASAEVLLVDALARASDGDAPALAAAQALEPPARSQALIRVAAARARRGESAAALALLAEIEADWQREARLVLLEEELDRGDLARAADLAAELDPDSRIVASARLCEERARHGDREGALAAAGEIGDPFVQATAFESLGWTAFARGDEDDGKELFARALSLASEVARRGGTARRPGVVGQEWLDMAVRLQAALGDEQSAAANVARSVEPAKRASGWANLGRACGRRRNFAAVEGLLAELRSTEDRLWIVCGFASGASASGVRVRPPGASA